MTKGGPERDGEFTWTPPTGTDMTGVPKPALIPVLLALCSACVTEPEIRTLAFIIKVDSISAPDSVASQDSFSASFLGRVGPNECYRLTAVSSSGDTSAVDLTFRGEHTVGTVCAERLVSLEYQRQFAPPRGDPFTLRVHQPDGSLLVKLVHRRKGSASTR
ncbi:MAG: hypothetical protein Q8K82_00595 [Gemmatimonadaceae bacterium]|nr:hypothetical protein [Gemmatimonadaceae bacterium]